MNILMVGTTPDLITKEGGAAVRFRKLAVLFSRNNNVVYLEALPRHDTGVNTRAGPLGETADKVYYFKQLFVFGKCAAQLTDLNIAFLLRIRDVVRREKIDLICITGLFGIISASLICPRTPVVYDSHCIVIDHARSYFQRLKMDFKIVRAPLINKIVEWLLLTYIRLLERLACRRARHIMAITDADKREFTRRYHIDESKITTIPIWVAVDDASKVPSKQKQSVASGKINVIFLGSYRPPGNYEAFKSIENYIAPEVGKYNDSIQFLLAGIDVPQFERERLKSLGYVEDLSAFLRDADIAIVPVLYETGVLVKILDFMAAGLPVITTRKVIEGIEAENGKHAIILDTVDENFINAILSLASDKKKRELLGQNARELARKKYNRENIQSELDKMLVRIKAEVIN
jgi:glycosyltransferase involved in cell wall biosynthesis